MSKGRTSKASPDPEVEGGRTRTVSSGSPKKQGKTTQPKAARAHPPAAANKTQTKARRPKSTKGKSAAATSGRAAKPKPAERAGKPEKAGPASHAESSHAVQGAAQSGLVERWVRKGQALGRLLAEHGAEKHEYRADLKDGRFVWMAPEGYVSAEAKACVLCSWSRSTHVLVMAWADPLVRYASVRRIDTLEDEHDNVGEEQAWKLAMEAAELSGAEYLYRVPTPHAWYFLGLRELQFDAALPSFRPTSPVGLVLRELVQAREAVESRAEPASVTSERLSDFGRALVHQAEYAYRGTDWVEHLLHTGRRLEELALGLKHFAAKQTQKASSVVVDAPLEQWLPRDRAVELIAAISGLEDEWQSFEAQPHTERAAAPEAVKKGARRSRPH